MLLIAVNKKLGPETDINVNNDSLESTPSPAFKYLTTYMHIKSFIHTGSLVLTVELLTVKRRCRKSTVFH